MQFVNSVTHLGKKPFVQPTSELGRLLCADQNLILHACLRSGKRGSNNVLMRTITSRTSLLKLECRAFAS